MNQAKFFLRLLLCALPGLLLWWIAPHSLWGPLLAGGLPLGAGGVLDQKTLQGLATWDGGFWSTFAVVGNFVLLASQMLNGSTTFLTLTGAAGAANATTATAQLLVQQFTAAYGTPPAGGETFQFEIQNQTNGIVTLVAGTGITINGTATVAAGANRTWLGTFSNPSNSTQAAVTLQNVASRSN